MNNMNQLSIAISSSWIRYALFDDRANLKIKKQIPTPTSNTNDFLKAIYAIIDDNLKSIYAIGLSVPGQVDPDDGIIYQGGSLPMLHGLSLGNILTNRYNLPVAMESAGICAAIAGKWSENLYSVSNGAALILDDGVSSGVILNGKIFTGAHLQAGGVGMILSDPLEDDSNHHEVMFNTCSATKMIQTIGKAIDLNDPNDDTKVFKAIENNEDNARKLFDSYCRDVAYMIANTQAVLDLSKYVISGKISTQSILVPEINHQLQLIHENVPLLKKTLTIPDIETSVYKQDTDLYGAYYYSLYKLDFQKIEQKKDEE